MLGICSRFGYKSPERRAFHNAKARCQCKKAGYYRNYGARGIEFKFESFAQWLKELGPRPSPQHSVERKDNNGHYEPGNVRWATRSEQNKNRRPIPEGTRKIMSAAARARCTPAWRRAVSKRVKKQHAEGRFGYYVPGKV